MRHAPPPPLPLVLSNHAANHDQHHQAPQPHSPTASSRPESPGSLVPQLRQAHKGGVVGAVVAHHLQSRGGQVAVLVAVCSSYSYEHTPNQAQTMFVQPCPGRND